MSENRSGVLGGIGDEESHSEAKDREGRSPDVSNRLADVLGVPRVDREGKRLDVAPGGGDGSDVGMGRRLDEEARRLARVEWIADRIVDAMIRRHPRLLELSGDEFACFLETAIREYFRTEGDR